EDALDARVDEHLEAVDARRVCDVDVAVADARAVLRRLRDGIDLGVDAAEAVLLDLAAGCGRAVDQAAHVETVRQPGRRGVVAGGENGLVAHDHRSQLGAQAGGAFRHLARDGHEVLVPGRPVAHDGITARSGWARGRTLRGTARG